ncbi:adenylate cyclase type 9 isoform X2 [Uranotaenia lowii]|nr:adenylate cyclase type 9 isoform X2 [Uranotaenia lowii]XP_055588060.1 adenylate cyclase type 9 isoform X2 [Uranotaenia lowii]XP_055588061.1 adenylate cyclase type 9 isoform X2 [Uranotaenia lowii]XP_055588062.1 adenylate cyclase type 9 isoform X2 [Uranotaenia lowii]
MPPVLTESQKGSVEDIQISLAPYIQSYLTQMDRRHSCCSVMLPVAFERAAPRSWFDPRFDSPVLEGQYQASVFPQIRLKFRFALFYILLCSLVWLIYFLLGGGPTRYSLLTVAIGLILVFGLVGMWVTHTDAYRAYTDVISSACAILLCLFSLFLMLFTDRSLSPLGHFSICIEIVMLIYTIIPLPLWLCGSITVAYSVCFEVLSFFHQHHYDQHPHIDDLEGPERIEAADGSNFVYKIVIIRVLIQLCVHLMGVHILIMTVVRMRGTFMKVGQNLLVRRQLEMEKQLKEKMIHSMMPPKVADLLLKESGSVVKGMSFDQCPPRRATPSDLKSLFRPFHMNSMENVSILFADIVGFTKMSSNKTAEQLVEILNDLFERFDDLCLMNGCEKISTLGDCYYCVSGCPEPRPDHAICCVEMGLGMIQSLRVFDAQRQEGVKMRVGVHTGTVLCGIVGTKRVKFDVWSNDVTLANRMESSGRPDQVHVSEETCSFLGDAYIIEEGEEVDGHRTYFVLGKKQDLVSSITEGLSSLGLPGDGSHLLATSPLDGDHPNNHHHQQHNHHHHLCGVGDVSCLSQSTTNLSSIHHPAVPPASPAGPVSSSLNASPVSTPRPRIASLSKMTKFLKGMTSGANHQVKDLEKPRIIVSTKSMPNGIDSDGEGYDDGLTVAVTTEKFGRFRNWKMGKLLKKIESGPGTTAGLAINGGSQFTNVVLAPELQVKDCDISRKCDEVPCVVEQAGGLTGAGYQQLPIVIVTPRPSCHTLDVTGCTIPPGVRSRDREGSKSISGGCGADNNSSLSQNSVFDDIIDVRSYISASRSDISPFARTGSYRSQCEKTSLVTEAPSGRPRSSTIAANGTDMNSRHSSLCPSGRLICDGASLCPSATSRKDSGIRSNSRRSSIQQHIMLMNQSAALSAHRVSGYFTSSQSSLSAVVAAAAATVTEPSIAALKSNGELNDYHCVIKEPHPDPLAACLQQLRKQSDLQLIRCVRDNARSQRSYLVKPPLAPISLRFKSRQMEHEFRYKAHRFGNEPDLEEGPPTLATPKYNTYIDIFVSFLIYLATSTSLFLLSPSTYLESYKVWVCIFMAFSTLQLFAIFICTKQVCRRTHKFARRSRPLNTQSCFDSLLRLISNWYPWHLCGAIMMSLPVVSILTNFSMMDVTKFKIFEFHYGFLMFICVIHFCNFTQLNWWMRNALAFCTSVAFVLIAITHMLELKRSDLAAAAIANNGTSNNGTEAFNGTTVDPELHQAQFDWFNDYRIEIYVDLVLLLVLVCFLNREFEISYRLSFYGSAVANQDKIRVQNMKNQADMLLHNIIPKHVAEQLKNTAKYSENHHNIGIIFASIVNFNEMYDESYLGGKEYLRVLNELIGDFDELLARPEFRCVEKIKTIGSTFMAASGLDPSSRGEDFEHLYTLMDFAIAMQQVVDSFNRDLLEFNLIMRVGYNFGDVTAGVIGTSKLYYDIWGDAVNVASRMDSTGVPGRIQVGSACIPVLTERYDFEPRGKVYVKGKDHMEVYLLVAKKPDLLGPPELDFDPV